MWFLLQGAVLGFGCDQQLWERRDVVSWAGSKGNLWTMATHRIPESLRLEKPSQTIVSSL